MAVLCESSFHVFRHEEVQDGECHCRDSGEEEECGVEVEIMHDGAGDSLTERSADTDAVLIAPA